MAKLFIYKVDNSGDYQLVGSAETEEQALAEAIDEHEKKPHYEYRIFNPNLGVVEVISACSNGTA